MTIHGVKAAIWNDSLRSPKSANPPQMTPLNKDFLEFIALLEKERVEYLIVGGYAVAVHGFPRYTGDIDFFVAVDPDNAEKLLRVFDGFGFGNLGLCKSDFLQEDFVVEIGREPRKIQILTGIDGVNFNECLANRLYVEIGGMSLPFIGKQDLIRNKRAAGRPKDRIDVEAISED